MPSRDTAGAAGEPRGQEKDSVAFLRNWAADIRASSGVSIDADRLDEIASEISALRAALEDKNKALAPFAEAGRALMLTGGKNPKMSGERLAEHLETARRAHQPDGDSNG